MASRNSLKTPINKALLTPCRRVGLSRTKKPPTPLNLNSPAALNTPKPLGTASDSKKTPLKAIKPVNVDLPSPLNPDNQALNNKTPLKITETHLGTPIAGQSGTTTPLKKQEKKKAKKLFDSVPQKDLRKEALEDINKNKKIKEEETTINKKQIYNQENYDLNNSFEAQPLQFEEVKTPDVEQKEIIRPDTQHRKNEKLVQKLKDTLNKVKKIDSNNVSEKLSEKLDEKEASNDKIMKKQNSLEIETETPSKKTIRINKDQNEIAEKNAEKNTKKKPSMFRKVTSSIKNRKNVENSPVNLGKFTTSEWLEDDDFRDLKEKQFDWDKLKQQKESPQKNDIKNNIININSCSDSEEEIFKKHTGKNASKRKRKAAKIIDSSSDELENENTQENAMKKEISNKDHLDSDSDEEFAKGPIKIRKKHSKSKKTSLKNTVKCSKESSENLVSTTSKKLKKEVTVNIEKMAKSEIEKHNKINNENRDKAVTNDVKEPDKTDKNNKDVDPEKEKQQLLDQVNAMKSLIHKKEQALENLKRAQIYRNKHDTKQLEELSNVWLNGCRMAIADLLKLLNQHGPITMKSLLVKLQIPPEILVKLDIGTEDEETET